MTALGDPGYAIQNLKARYCAAVDRCPQNLEEARAALRSIFLPDVAADYGYGPVTGADALTDFLSTAIAGSSEWLLHMIHSPLIDVADVTATGDWTVMVHLKRRQSGQVDVIIGRYSDAFRLTRAGWRIERVRFARLV